MPREWLILIDVYERSFLVILYWDLKSGFKAWSPGVWKTKPANWRQTQNFPALVRSTGGRLIDTIKTDLGNIVETAVWNLISGTMSNVKRNQNNSEIDDTDIVVLSSDDEASVRPSPSDEYVVSLTDLYS